MKDKHIQRQDRFASCLDSIVSVLSEDLNREVKLLKANGAYIFYLPHHFGHAEEDSLERGFSNNLLAQVRLNDDQIEVSVINRNAGYLVAALIKRYCEQQGFGPPAVLEDRRDEALWCADFEKVSSW